ncbi:MAG TPA: glycosyltransferase family 2 protein [Candidatus Nitrosocosmicus sp.]|nr:glycosyltransferase family 2 protein [Candidatus Nitrosocosmicus sp.]
MRKLSNFFKDIAIIVLTYNSQDKIHNTLRPITKFEEIIVIDNGSDDNTLSIISEYTKNIYVFKEKNMRLVRNYALSKTKKNWVLFIDSDEIISPHNLMRLAEKFYEKNSSFDGFWLARRNYFENKNNSYLKYGLFYPDYQLRLFKSKYSYKFSPHEEPDINKMNTFHLPNVEIYHYPDKSKYFSILGIFKFYNFIHNYSKDLVKYSYSYLLFVGFWKFIDLFFISLTRGKGFLDGYLGIVAAFNFASQISLIHFYAIYRKIKTK